MKSFKYLNICVALVLALVSGHAFAEIKLGLVDKQVLGSESLYVKSVWERMNKDFTSRKDGLIAKDRDLKAKFEALERDKDVLSEADRAKRERELVKLQQTLQSESDAFQNDVAQRQEKERAAFEKILSEVLTDLAKEEKLDLIIDQQVALFNAGKSDYTHKALQALDKSYKDSKK